MTSLRAWHVNVLGAAVNLGLGFYVATTGPATAESLIVGIAVLAVAVVGTAASIPSTVLFALGRYRRAAAVLDVLVAVGLVLAFSPVALTFGVFLLVAAALGWREADAST